MFLDAFVCIISMSNWFVCIIGATNKLRFNGMVQGNDPNRTEKIETLQKTTQNMITRLKLAL